MSANLPQGRTEIEEKARLLRSAAEATRLKGRVEQLEAECHRLSECLKLADERASLLDRELQSFLKIAGRQSQVTQNVLKAQQDEIERLRSNNASLLALLKRDQGETVSVPSPLQDALLKLADQQSGRQELESHRHQFEIGAAGTTGAVGALRDENLKLRQALAQNQKKWQKFHSEHVSKGNAERQELEQKCSRLSAELEQRKKDSEHQVSLLQKESEERLRTAKTQWTQSCQKLEEALRISQAELKTRRVEVSRAQDEVQDAIRLRDQAVQRATELEKECRDLVEELKVSLEANEERIQQIRAETERERGTISESFAKSLLDARESEKKALAQVANLERVVSDLQLKLQDQGSLRHEAEVQSLKDSIRALEERQRETIAQSSRSRATLEARNQEVLQQLEIARSEIEELRKALHVSHQEKTAFKKEVEKINHSKAISDETVRSLRTRVALQEDDLEIAEAEIKRLKDLLRTQESVQSRADSLHALQALLDQEKRKVSSLQKMLDRPVTGDLLED